MSRRGFTLLELIVVIVIIGVLATLGLTQYGRMVERARWLEAKEILGDCRKLAVAYYLQNGSATGMQNSDLNIGIASDQIPSACRSSHYFRYAYGSTHPNGCLIELWAYRCLSGGKSPDGTSPQIVLEFQTGLDGSSPDLFCAPCGSYPWGNCACGPW
jgi:prepilin-type N-terminal cleavage/methylation domain-containing protein